MTTEPADTPLPTLPPDTRGAAKAFHNWCAEELRRRRSRDVELDEARFARATRLVLGHLGVRGEDPTS